MLSALSVAAAVALSCSDTLPGMYEPVPFAGHFALCTAEGLEVLTHDGDTVRVLGPKDGLPGTTCLALQVAGERLFAATGAGIVSLDSTFTLEPVLDVKWHTLPPADDASSAEYVERLDLLAKVLPSDATYTALTSRYAGTEDGRVLELGTQRAWTVTGPVLVINEEPNGVRIVLEEGHLFLAPQGRLTSR